MKAASSTAKVRGLHHVTATVDTAQEDLDFYTGLLGLRLVKKTVNFDNNQVYHFYYGNERGSPGTIMTTFPYGRLGVPRGLKGAGQVITTSFAVRPSAIDFWKSRLDGARVPFEETTRFGEPLISVDDPASLRLELTGAEEDDREPWTTSEIGESSAIKGVHSVTLSLTEPTRTISLLTEVLGFSILAEEANRIKLGLGSESPTQLDILHEPKRDLGVNGIGTVHHVAFAASSDEEQQKLRTALIAQGYRVTPVMDRQYFRSIYFREPGGVLFEVATVMPGFAIDEPLEALGRELKLPEWEEVNRTLIERSLPRVHS